MDHTRAIAAHERLSGSPGEREAFTYLIGVLEGCGLCPQLLTHTALVGWPGPAQVQLLELGETFTGITHALAAAAPAGVEAGLVTGAPGAEIRGKVVLIDGLAAPARVRAYERQGAKAQIYINDDHTHEMVVSTVWGSPALETAEFMPMTPVVSLTREPGRRLRARLDAGGPVRVRVVTEVENAWKELPLLVADIRGPDTRPPYVLVLGHVDAWHQGAMDNAAGNAAMLEMARLLQLHRSRLLRHVRLVFCSGHSHGRYAGSAWFCDRHWQDLHDNCIVHVNVDCPGARGASVLSEAATMPQTYRVAAEVVRGLTGQELQARSVDRSGDQSFWGAGVPSLFITLSEQPPAGRSEVKLTGPGGSGAGRTDGLGWWWHTAEDTPDKIDRVNLVRDTAVYLASVLRFATDPVLPLQYSRLLDHIVGGLDTVVGLPDVPQLAACREVAAASALALKQLEDSWCHNPIVGADRCLMRLGRILIPPAMTRGDPFVHDSAEPTAPLPILDGARTAVGEVPGSERYHLARVSALRAANRLLHALLQAQATVNGGMDS
jgi:Iap family predicted aminopeptidase